jgi:hypothetical protein
MNDAVTIVSREPGDCDDNQMDDFTAFVLAGGEVTPRGLERRIRSPVRLIFLSEQDCLPGVAALKRSNQAYRKRVSSKSGFPLPETKYPSDLGWVFVMPSARGACQVRLRASRFPVSV